jgi:hypothetical protein
MVRKNPKIGKSQIAGGVKVQLPLDSPLIGVLKTDQYDLVNLYTNDVIQSFLPTDPDDGEGIPDPFPDPDPDPVVLGAPNLSDIVLIGSTGKRYYYGQTIDDPEIYYDSNNNRMLKVTFEVKNSIGDIVKGAIII